MTEQQVPVLNWIPRFDERSKNFPVRSVIATPPKLKNKLWVPGPILDQGREGACVGFGWTAEALATPIPVNLSRMKIKVATDPNVFARTVYQRAKVLDEWEGEDYDGTSVLAGAKVLKELGLVKEYRWAFSINDVIDAIISKGPVVLGIYWYAGMYDAPDGILNVAGSVVGGHCITAIGYRLGKYTKTGVDSVILQNSWGKDWGINGLAELKVTQLDMLLRNDGEACVPTSRSYGR
jgi:hypothetical protein